MIKDYCTQNNGDCSSCSLSSYGRDCQSIPAGRGGSRPNAGRKTLDDAKKKKQVNYYLTDTEKIKMDEHLKTLRA